MTGQETKSVRLLAEEAFLRSDYAEAERLFREVITLLEIAVGDHNIEVAIALECLSRALELQGNLDEAEKVRHRAAMILCVNHGRGATKI